MENSVTIRSVTPSFAIAGGEIEVATEGFSAIHGEFGCYIGALPARVVAASSRRVLAIVPEGVAGEAGVELENRHGRSNTVTINVGRTIAEEMHIVANPAIDPRDGSVIITRSGSRGQKLEHTLYRIEPDGYVDELPAEIMNPTGIAFSPNGEMYVTNRAEGTVCRIDHGEGVAVYASGLGIATGIAFDAEGVMYVGDRSGTIYRIREFGRVSEFAEVEPSVAAYHLAFGPDGRLFVTAPGLSSHDCIYAIDADGKVERFIRGFGRPQGLAFDIDGNLYAAACYKGRHGIVKIDPAGIAAETVVAGNAMVGLCFDRDGNMIVATNDTLYSLKMGISGALNV